jgi:hypothetical protein
MSLANMNMTLG